MDRREMRNEIRTKPAPHHCPTPRRHLLLLAMAAACLSCGEVLGQAPELRFELAIRVVSDDGRPLPGAQIVTNSTAPVRTGEAGEAVLSVVGREGERRSFAVSCPSDFEAPAVPLIISLRKNAEASKRPVYQATCAPLRRTVVVGIRAENGPNLRVLYLGEEVARTDRFGAAHVLLRVAPGETFRVTLDTSDSPRIRPLSPSAEYTVGTSDELFLFDPRLTVEAPRPVSPRPRVLLPSGPTRL
jgi:hypothetical protein